MTSTLPPGQRAWHEFPRFGVVEFAKRPLRRAHIRLEVRDPNSQVIVVTEDDLASIPRAELTVDFHCAAGWSYGPITWSGFRFADVWNACIDRERRISIESAYAVLRCEDGYRTSLPLTDLLAPDVLIADRLNQEPLSIEHGFPVRLIAPAHYGYKSAKHLIAIEIRSNDEIYRPLLPRFMEHPRARVALEERGQLLPGWLLRYLFRPFIQPIIRKIKALGNPPQN